MGIYKKEENILCFCPRELYIEKLHTGKNQGWPGDTIPRQYLPQITPLLMGSRGVYINSRRCVFNNAGLFYIKKLKFQKLAYILNLSYFQRAGFSFNIRYYGFFKTEFGRFGQPYIKFRNTSHFPA